MHPTPIGRVTIRRAYHPNLQTGHAPSPTPVPDGEACWALEILARSMARRPLGHTLACLPPDVAERVREELQRAADAVEVRQ